VIRSSCFVTRAKRSLQRSGARHTERCPYTLRRRVVRATSADALTASIEGTDRSHWLYEPKFDGFRGLLCQSSDGSVRVTSRQGKDLTDWFLELAKAGKCLPPSTVLDGEIVIADGEGRADFGALQRRLGVASRRSSQTAANCPAILQVFDVLECAGIDLMQLPLIERRHRLEDLLRDCAPRTAWSSALRAMSPPRCLYLRCVTVMVSCAR
jgi:ATP-dependent DNA ligase